MTSINRAYFTISNTPGAGDDLTVSTAVSGPYRTLGASQDGQSFDVAIVDGSAWEIRTGCTYTHSGTTLTRGTLEDSSTGSAITLTSAAVVMVTATAEDERRWDSGALKTSVASSDADVTGVVGTLHALDLSGLTANRTFTLPAVAAVDDRVGIVITTGDADYELLITAASGDTLNGVAGGTEWSRLFITGETLTLRCTVANTTWVVERDGRIPQLGGMSLTGSDITTSTAGAYWGLDCDTELVARGCIVSVAGAGVSTIKWRRANYAIVSGNWTPKAGGNFADNEFSGWAVSYGGAPVVGTTIFSMLTNHAGIVGRGRPTAGLSYVQIPAGSLVQISPYNETTANLGARALTAGTNVSLTEVL